MHELLGGDQGWLRRCGTGFDPRTEEHIPEVPASAASAAWTQSSKVLVWERERRADLMCPGKPVCRMIFPIKTSSSPDKAQRLVRHGRNLQSPDRGHLETRDQFLEAFLMFGVRGLFEQ